MSHTGSVSVFGAGPKPEEAISWRGGGGGGGTVVAVLGGRDGGGRLEGMKGEGAEETETGMEARGGLGGLAAGTDW